LEEYAKEIKVIIADLKKYLAKLDEYAEKPMSGQDYYDIHQYNVVEAEYKRLASLKEQLDPLDREELERYFLAISQCSQPFSTFHVEADNHKKVDPKKFIHAVDILKKTVHKTIQYLAGSIQQAPKKDDRTCTLEQFMTDYCEIPTGSNGNYFESKRNLIYSRNREKLLRLPKMANKKWVSGQAKIFNKTDLLQKWPKYCIAIPTLPPLKNK
jgi:hypothetical protein